MVSLLLFSVMNNVDLSKTLDELEGVDWGEPTYSSGLVIECHRLRKVPLKEFTPGNLRIMIGQQMSLEYLLPLAFERLSKNPFVEGNYYPGDLLVSVLSIPDKFWKEHPDLYWELSEIMNSVMTLRKTIEEAVIPEIERLRQLAQTF
jgi:hypothetical protein